MKKREMKIMEKEDKRTNVRQRGTALKIVILINTLWVLLLLFFHGSSWTFPQLVNGTFMVNSMYEFETRQQQLLSYMKRQRMLCMLSVQRLPTSCRDLQTSCWLQISSDSQNGFQALNHQVSGHGHSSSFAVV